MVAGTGLLWRQTATDCRRKLGKKGHKMEDGETWEREIDW